MVLRVDLLIIDDFALQPMDSIDTADIYELIVERHRAAATITISNREPVEVLGHMADPLLAQSAIDRLQSVAHELASTASPTGVARSPASHPTRPLTHPPRPGDHPAADDDTPTKWSNAIGAQVARSSWPATNPALLLLEELLTFAQPQPTAQDPWLIGGSWL